MLEVPGDKIKTKVEPLAGIGHNRGPDYWRELAQKAVDQLNGTCRSFAELGEEYEEGENNSLFCAVVDEQIFCCTTCNWWCEQSECNEDDSGQWVCDECKDD